MRNGKIACVVVFTAGVVGAASFAQGALGLTRYDGHSVVRVDVSTPERAAFLRELGVDEWTHGDALGLREWRVTPTQRRALEEAGVGFEVVVPDVQALVDAERASLAAPRGADAYFTAYHRYEDMRTRLDGLIADHPNLASPVLVGHSLQGREIFGVRLSTAPGESDRPAVVFSAMQHAREWLAGTTAMYLAHELVENYGADPRITAALDDVDVYIIPVMNPDGYVWTWDVDRLWRKNRRSNGGSFGVDTNRNFSVGWGLNGGSSAIGSSETYRGVAPFSEPESTALADFLSSIPRVRAHVDLHTYSELVLSPWGWTEDPCDDAAAFDALNAAIFSAIEGVHGRAYTVGPAGSTLYIASGTAPDWSYGELGVFGWTIELRPASAAQGGFVMPPSQITPTGEEIMPVTLLLAEFAAHDVYFHSPRVPTYLDASSGAEVGVSATPMRGAVIDQNASALRYRVGDSGEFLSAPLAFGDFGDVRGELPGAACDTDVAFYFEIVTGAGVETYPAPGAAAPLTLTAMDASVALEDDFESDLGWTIGAPGDTANTGVWVRGVPNATNFQPGSGDPLGSGGACFYTGFSAPGAADGVEDVDGGATTLLSPVFDASGDGEAYLTYSRWFGTNGSPGNDYLRLSLSNDGGATWTVVETLSENIRRWERREIRVADYLEPTSTMRVRFVAADPNPASVAEAAVDDVRFFALGCEALPGDTNGDGVVNFADLNAVLGAFGTIGAGPADVNGDGVVDFGDLNLVLSNFGAR